MSYGGNLGPAVTLSTNGVSYGVADGTVASIQPSGDVTGVADTAALIAAHANLPVYGGQITLGAGQFYLVPNQVIFTKPVKLVGQGSNDAYPWYGSPVGSGNNAITTINCNYTTGTAVTFLGNSSQCEEVHFSNSTTATSAIAILMNGSSGFKLCHNSMFGFFTQIQLPCVAGSVMEFPSSAK